MTLARQIVAIAAALLQLTLPLAAYARAPGIPGANDLCSAAHAARHDGGGGAPSGHHRHLAHCALCAHASPLAPPVSTPLQAPLLRAVAVADNAVAFALSTPLRSRANARAPPRIELEPA